MLTVPIRPPSLLPAPSATELAPVACAPAPMAFEPRLRQPGHGRSDVPGRSKEGAMRLPLNRGQLGALGVNKLMREENRLSP
jgi:hypothetical protein